MKTVNKKKVSLTTGTYAWNMSTNQRLIYVSPLSSLSLSDIYLFQLYDMLKFFQICINFKLEFQFTALQKCCDQYITSYDVDKLTSSCWPQHFHNNTRLALATDFHRIYRISLWTIRYLRNWKTGDPPSVTGGNTIRLDVFAFLRHIKNKISRYPPPNNPPFLRDGIASAIRDLYITTSIASIASPQRLFSIFNISLRALDVLFIAFSAIFVDSISRSYWNASVVRSGGKIEA